MPNRTPSEINRRLAEYAGWQQWDGMWRRPDGSATSNIPDYWTSADAVLPLVERVCRERAVSFDFHTGFMHGRIYYDVVVNRDGDSDVFAELLDNTTLPAAICLALVAVLDGDSTNNERTDAK